MLRALGRGVWVLGLASLFMDMSSELAAGLLPAFLTGVLGASMLTIGLIEGVAEATAACTKLGSGLLSDFLGRRKPLVVAGYGLAALTKPLLPLAGSVGWVLSARFLDRVGKGIRGAPRDAMLAELAPPLLRGAAFGLRQSLDSVGAVLGPLLAIAAMGVFAGDIRRALWVAVLPALVTVALVALAVHEPRRSLAPSGSRPLRLAAARELGSAYAQSVALGFVFALGRFSEAFLVLRAQDAGLALGWLPLVLIVMNLVYAATAYPAGRAADRIGTSRLLGFGLVVLVLADLVLATASSPALALAGAALWGLHMGLTQGQFGKLVADSAPPELRATAFGIFHLLSGLGALGASLLAGWLWGRFGAPAAFLGGAGFALLTLLGILTSEWRRSTATV